MAPGPLDVPRREQLGRELRQSGLPLVAPDLQVDVDDVVVRGGDAAQAVADAEDALLGRRAVVPDDPHAVVPALDSVGAGRARTPELGAGARAVADVALRHRDLVDRLAVAERDVAVGAAEVAREGEGDALRDDETAVTTDLDDDVRPRQDERLRGGVAGERERRQRGR